MLLHAAKASKDEAPKFQPSSVRKDGKAVVIEARCTGIPAPTFTWTKGGVELKPRVGKYELSGKTDGPVFVQVLRILVSCEMFHSGWTAIHLSIYLAIFPFLSVHSFIYPDPYLSDLSQHCLLNRVCIGTFVELHWNWCWRIRLQC